jgi:spartin
VAPHPSTNPDGVTPPPRAVQWLTSDSTRKGLDTAQLYTGKAYQVSQKTLNAVEGVMTRVLAPNKGKGRAVPLPPKPDSGPPLMFDPNLPPPVRTPVRPASAQPGMPPPYSSTKAASSAYSVASPPYTQVGPPPTLPPRKGAASAPPSPRSATSPTPLDRLSKKARFVLSAQLVLSTLDASTKKVANAGTEGLAAAVGHKYGASAESSTRVLTGTARNVALVYVDVTGLGRRALIKRAGMAVIKTRINGKAYNLKTDSSGQVVEVQPSSPVAGSPIGRRSTEKVA